MNLCLDSPVQYVPRVGPFMAGKLKKLGIQTVRDLLFYVPFRYNDFSHIVAINRIVPNTTVTVEGEVQSIKNVFTKNGKKLQEGTMRDATGILSVVWFNQLYLPKIIHPGDRLSLSGPIRFFGRQLVMESPTYEIVSSNQQELLHTGRLVPVYSETNGVTSKWIRGRIAHILTFLSSIIQEELPEWIRTHYTLMDISDALTSVHFPKNIEAATHARHRLAFDELFFLQLTARLQKKQWEEQEHAPMLSIETDTLKTFIDHLPFTLTNDQNQAIQRIADDMNRPYPMNRLLEGDVGSGKTVVAAAACYIAGKNGYSSVILSPTQILAEQHFTTIQTLLAPFNISTHLVLGGTKKKSDILSPARLAEFESKQAHSPMPSVYIGTHALLNQNIMLPHIGLIIVDEQQRFGTTQRTLIRKKGKSDYTPHFLTMTATPIPRTLALTLYGNLDLSVLSAMPHGRIPIKTWVVPEQKRTSAYAWIKKELLTNKSRMFLVCPFIEESESMTTIKAATKEFDRLRTQVFPDIPIGLLHGKLKPKEKTAVLETLRTGKISILVATPVVEVGIDIPEASIIMIEAADRFGLSQLHQLRGRVGRGTQASYCLLFSDAKDEMAIKRLKILESVNNGPELAEYDLMLRGEGDIMGIRQHGLPPLTLASLKDKTLVAASREAAETLITRDPDISEFPLLRKRLKNSTIEEEIQD